MAHRRPGSIEVIAGVMFAGKSEEALSAACGGR